MERCGPGYRSRLMAPVDRVLFWVSGERREGLGRGVWGLGHVVAEPSRGSSGLRGSGVASRPITPSASGSRSTCACSIGP